LVNKFVDFYKRLYKQTFPPQIMATKKKPVQKTPKAPEMSKEEEVGYHKGSVMTLANERNELVRIIQTIDTIMQAHLKRMEELGVKINKK
jgi:hypothetical protein